GAGIQNMMIVLQGGGDCLRGLSNVFRAIDLDENLIDVGCVFEPNLGRCDRDNHDIILSKTTTLRGQHADNAEGLGANTDALANRVVTRCVEEVMPDGITEQRNRGTLRLVIRAKPGALSELPVLDTLQAAGCTFDLGGPVLIAVDDLIAGDNQGT